jgi:hypothetical protein
MKNITFLLGLAVVGLILWRNYGVIPLGSSIQPENAKTPEEKELNKAIKKLGEVNEGQIIQTSFGQYEFADNKWSKTKELFQLINQ